MLKLPDLVTLNFVLNFDISTKLQWHSLATHLYHSTKTEPLLGLVRCWGCCPTSFKRAGGAESAVVRSSGCVSGLGAGQRQHGHLALLLPAKNEDEFSKTYFLNSKSKVQLRRRQDASWSFKTSRIICESPEARHCFTFITVSLLPHSTVPGQE